MKQSLTLAALLALASSGAYAALPSFESLDRDGDGAISQEEAAASDELMTGFDKADVDKDGKLTPAEYEAIK